MSGLDLLIVVGAALAVALALLVRGDRPWARRWLGRALFALGVAAIAQLVLEGFTWHFLPLYVLLLELVRRASPRRVPEVVLSLGSRAGLLALLSIALLPWMLFLPVPALLEPGGPYLVGTEVLRWVDERRPEEATEEASGELADHRNVIVQVFYPADLSASGEAPGGPAPYLDGLGELPRFVSLIPGLAMAHYDRIDTHARLSPRLAAPPTPSGWPVVLFSPGYGGPRAFYTGVLVDLASRGFVVLAIDHPYEAAITRLADGRLVTPIERFLPGDSDRVRYMERQQAVRLADVRFVVDRLHARSPALLTGALAGPLDLHRLSAIGHSFGGAVAALALASDPRLAAAANLDGTPYGALPAAPLPGSLLVVESDRAITRHSRQFLDGNAHLLGLISTERAAGYRFELVAADHYAFTDVPLFLSPPARLAMSLLMGGSRGAAATQRAAVDLLAAFLSAAPPSSLSPSSPAAATTSMQALTSPPAAAALLPAPAVDPVEAAAARHGNIRGGRTARPALAPAPAPSGGK